ncbi:MAG: hypothetical protein OXS29_02030 [bacterium]|nr:hypothetical protein [bacterium]MDE0290421.1 hypothetical protein [bacterium]MDE0437815.1 hypothetical protein [bacterium]
MDDSPCFRRREARPPRRFLQLRDPAILADGEEVYVYYAIGGEAGMAGARITGR